MSQPDLLRYEKEAWDSGFFYVAGVDEAGRGPLAGPVVAAAVYMPPDALRKQIPERYRKLTDSKQLSEKQREQFFESLVDDQAVRIGVSQVESAEIDRINILQATHRAMREALVAVEADFALVDGLPVSGLPCPSQSIVKGDALSLLIAAGSVVAKVTRDREMVRLDQQYPRYGFAQHKGYGTAAHLRALKEHGACPVHRRSFRPVAERDQLDLL